MRPEQRQEYIDSARQKITDAESMINGTSNPSDEHLKDILGIVWGAQIQPGDLVGVDVIIDKDGNPVVIEINAGANVGGIGTITRLEGAPPSFLADILVPEWAAGVEKKERKEVISVSGLRRLDHNMFDEMEVRDTLLYGSIPADFERIDKRAELREMNPFDLKQGTILAETPFLTDDEKWFILYGPRQDRSYWLKKLNIFR